MKQIDLAKILGMPPQSLNALVKGRKRASPKLAERIELATGIDRAVWIWGTPRERQEALKSAAGGKR